MAVLAERLTQARRILVIDTPKTPGGGAAALVTEPFVGQLSTGAILQTIGPKIDAVGAFTT